MHKFGVVHPSLHAAEQGQDYLHSVMERQRNHLPEEEDFVAGLVEQMAHSMLDDLEPVEEASESFKCDRNSRMIFPERPGSSSWSSSNASSSPVVSPPTPLHHLPFDAQQNDAWELLQMAVMRLKMGASLPLSNQQYHSREEQLRAYRQPGNGGIQRDFPTVYSSGKAPCPTVFEQHDWKHRSTASNGLYKPGTCYHQAGWNRRNTRASATQYQQQQQSVRQQQHQQHQQSFGSSRGSYHNHPGFYRTIQQQQQQQNTVNTTTPQWQSSSTNNGSGMRAVFLRGPGLRSTSTAGTGVFLPQATGSNREHRRKPSCSTVLLPSRIVEVLNLNVEDLHCQQQQQSHSSTSTSSSTGAMGDAAAGFVPESEEAYLSAAAQLSKSYSACSPTRWHHHHTPAAGAEHALPTEWTY